MIQINRTKVYLLNVMRVIDEGCRSEAFFLLGHRLITGSREEGFPNIARVLMKTSHGVANPVETSVIMTPNMAVMIDRGGVVILRDDTRK